MVSGKWALSEREVWLGVDSCESRERSDRDGDHEGGCEADQRAVSYVIHAIKGGWLGDFIGTGEFTLMVREFIGYRGFTLHVF